MEIRKKICIKVYDYNKKYTFRQKENFVKLVWLISFLPMYNIMYIVTFIYLKVYILLYGCLINKIYFIGHYIKQQIAQPNFQWSMLSPIQFHVNIFSNTTFNILFEIRTPFTVKYWWKKLNTFGYVAPIKTMIGYSFRSKT